MKVKVIFEDKQNFKLTKKKNSKEYFGEANLLRSENKLNG